MSDRLTEELAGFDQRLNPEEPAETTPEETPEASAEAETPEETAAEVEAEAEKLLAGKYRSAEELEHAYTELQSRLGVQGSELGELRKTLEKLNDRLDRDDEAQIDQRTVDWLDELVEENPHGAAVWALQNDSTGALYRRVTAAWSQTDPDAVVDFKVQLATAQLRNEFEKMLSEQTGPLVAQARDSGIAQAWAAAANEIPDLNNEREQVLAAAELAPEIAAKVVDGTPEERQQAIRTLHTLSRGMQAETVETQTRRASDEERQAARAVKQDGTVVTQTQAQTPAQESEGDRWLREIGFDAVLDRHSPPG